jgi:dihydroxyacetone kinase
VSIVLTNSGKAYALQPLLALQGPSSCQAHVELPSQAQIPLNAGEHAIQGVKVVYNSRQNPAHVAVVSGGGSGHEPAMAGFVGPGMLSAAVAGEVFASPSARAVYEAIMKVTGAPGCLVIVLNYTGDRLNFGHACELAKGDGREVELMAVAEDCGVEIPGIAGPRGIAGTTFVLKVGFNRAMQTRSRSRRQSCDARQAAAL